MTKHFAKVLSVLANVRPSQLRAWHLLFVTVIFILLTPAARAGSNFSATLEDCFSLNSVCVEAVVTNRTPYDLEFLQLAMEISLRPIEGTYDLCLGGYEKKRVSLWVSGWKKTIEWSPLSFEKRGCVVTEVTVSVMKDYKKLAVFTWR